MGEGLPRHRDACALEHGARLRARERPVGERLRQGAHPTRGCRVADALLAQAPLVGGAQLRRGEQMQQRLVLGGDQVQRPAIHPRDEERPLVQRRFEGAAPSAERAHRQAHPARVLRLDGEQAPCGLDRTGGPAREPLRGEPLREHYSPSGGCFERFEAASSL